MPLPIFDAHLDLAYLAVSGRDMLAPLDPAAAPHPPAAVTLPALAAGNVRFALGTIFTERDGAGPEGYKSGDFDRAAVVGRAQLEAYLTWRDRGQITLDRFRAIRAEPGVGEIRGGMGVAEVVPVPLQKRLARLPATPALHCGILMENADPIRSPADLPWWKERGLVAIGMAWSRSSRYAGGNTTDEGVSAAGKELVREMDRLGIVHDASHLSDRAFDELCGMTTARVIASHSNCRAIADASGRNQRHLTDAQIREIGRRGGVIGLNLYSKFLDPACAEGGRATIESAVSHVERICTLTGSRLHTGIGTDMDGGFGADRMPLGIDSPADLRRLLDALTARNWSDADLLGFACGNWLRVLT